MNKLMAFTLTALAACSAQAFTGAPTVDFNNGTGGWNIQAPDNDPEQGWKTWIDPNGGKQGAGLHSIMPEIWDATWVNTTSALTGDLTKAGQFNISFDINAESIINRANGLEVTRDVVVELRSFTSESTFVSVFYNVGTIGAGMGWQHFSASIGDTASTTLPTGWTGNGGGGLEPSLPGGVTFADVLKNVDEVRITTAVPGFAYYFSHMDVKLDNISVSAVPEPGTLASMTAGLGLLLASRRRSRR